ncbi:MAG: NAD(P)H-binding protein [Gammaproteobacteria bacterium]|uniref:NAD-dependent epimerase/dehydratase family protein n=1 Tax=Hydrogenophaga sp. TaxID=1904254 RepID=UPI0025BDA7B7|nr:NAD-dependent epimerase/dehydratase family protein [Hydrogenophaga sp.]MBU4180638.1 NAD(P)H-binding protein [Gammaproteobacteria bacterium]MBU4279233.1 NAD(P)H-binding protein [Gammaproteobacteria bacterium]MBU4325539.1 NAD(P)H-binding protein [Gammaproteobacteria bacterium]MBU4505894.1 NAD(P)H-binding protein [Gammaproteobacteria bacterium]MCG2654651.1 NAD(P)H-binding protein [Hydrogenophaga sp.]
MSDSSTVLVLGASGGIGGEMARLLLARGWRVRAMKRGLGVARREQGGIEWVEGDALQAADVMAAVQGCSVIVHAVNPPGYRRWAEWVLPMIDNTIAAAQAQGATVVLPGTVYNYGPDAFLLIAEDAPQNAHTPKGRIRVELEQRLASAAQAGRMKAIVVRAGDFFGPRAGNNWFSQGMVKPGRAVRSVNTPAAPGVGHQFAYLPDVARTMAELLDRRDTLPAFASFHMAGHWDATGTALAEAVQRAVVRRGGAVPAMRPFPWWLVRLASPFVTTFRELLGMRYLWQQPVRLDNRRLVQQLGHEPHTPLDEAVEATLVGLGCLSQTATPATWTGREARS